MTASLLGSVSQSDAGVASGVLNAVRQAGGAIGVALFGGLAASPVSGIRDVFLLAMVILIAAAITAACLGRGSKPMQPAEGETMCPRPICR